MYEYSNNEIKCSSLFNGSGYESSQCANKERDEFKVETSWSRNTLNDYLYPTDGVNNSLSAAVSIPPGDYKYFNINASHISYRPFNDNVTMKLTGNLNLSKKSFWKKGLNVIEGFIDELETL